MRIGVNDSPPYARVNPDGTLDGFSVAVINEAARRRGMRLEWLVVPEGPDAALKSGKVDVWHLVTDLPERHRYIHFTDPWLRTKFALLVPATSAVQLPDDTAGLRIAYRGDTLQGRLAREFFPKARLIPEKAGQELVLLCRGDSDAEFIENKDMLAHLLGRPQGCGHLPMRAIAVRDASYQMAIGANAAGIDAAKRLRTEITAMAEDHTLDEFCRKWLFDTADETKVVSELAHAQRRSQIFRISAGILTFIVACLVIVIQRERLAQRAVKSAHEFASNVIDRAGGMMFIADRHGRIVRFNRACERSTGKTLEDVRGKKSWELFVPPNECAVVEAMFSRIAEGAADISNEHHWHTRDGIRLFSWSYSILLNKTGRVDHIVANGIDITKREAVEEKLGYEAAHDPLTSLPNRRQILRELEGAVSTANSGGPGFVLALSDLDHFKTINDTHGHEAGDEVLIYFASLLRSELHTGCVAGRLGGDEFCLVIRDSNAQRVLGEIQKRLNSHTFRSALGRTFHADVTFGCSSWCSFMNGTADLMRSADESLYIAKRHRPDAPSRFESDVAALEADYER